MLSEAMKKLTLLRAAMLKTKADGLSINPPAMTRTDYDRTRGAVFGVPVEIQDWLGTGGVFQRPGYPTFTEPGGRTRRKIFLGPDIKPGVATHELEHNLTQILGELEPPKHLVYPTTRSVPLNEVDHLLAGVDPTNSEIFPEWKGYQEAPWYLGQPAEFTRAAVRLYNLGNPKHKEQVAGYLPSLFEKLQLLPEDILKLLTPHTMAGVKKYDSPGVMM